MCVCAYVFVRVAFEVRVTPSTMKLSSIDLLPKWCTGACHASTTSSTSLASSSCRRRRSSSSSCSSNSSGGDDGSGPINQSRHPATEGRCLGQRAFANPSATSSLTGAVLTMLLLTLCALPVASPSRETPDPSAKRLHFDLMSPYNALVKPSGGPKHQLTVKMGLRLSQVLNVVSI